MEHSFDALDGITLGVTVRGDLDPRGRLAMVDAVLAQIDARRYRRILFDFRDARSDDLDVTEVAGIVGLLEYQGHADVRIAVVGDHRCAPSTIPIAHFDSRGAAEAWLARATVVELPRARHLSLVSGSRQTESQPSPPPPPPPPGRPMLRVVSNDKPVEAPPPAAQPPSAQPLAASAGTQDKIERLWSRIREFNDEPSANSGVPRDAIVAAFARIGLALPPDLAALYAWHDGIDNLNAFVSFNTLESALAIHGMLVDIDVDAHWFPVVSSNADVHICLDVSTGALHGVYPEGDITWQLAAHYTHCIDALLEGFQAGAFRFDAEAGHFETTDAFTPIRERFGVKELDW